MPSYNISSSNNYVIYTDQTGSSIFDSGGPSGGYSNSENIFFLIAPAYSTGTLTLNITSFGSQVSTDYLRIYDRYVPTASFSYSGVTAGTASLLAAINGSPSVPITVTSSTGKAYLRWSSDSATTGSGFALSWTGSGFYNVDSSSNVPLNQYAATFPRTASSSSYITIPKTLISGSGTVLSASKDILIGFWAKLDNSMQGSANALGIFGIGGTNVPAGGSNLTVLRAGSSDDLRLAYVDINSGFNSTATDMVMGGGAAANATYPPQWHHYGIALKKNSTTTANVRFYRDGQVFATNAHTKSLAFSRVQAIDDPVIGNYRDYLTMTGIIQSAGGWSGSLDDVFLATVTTGSTQAEYNTFFSNIYNSGNFSEPTSVITASLSASLNPLVIFNLRFEETGSLLNMKDYGSFGNYHTATSTASSPVAPYLTSTSSGISYTPYSSLAYSASLNYGAASISSSVYVVDESVGFVTIPVRRISGSQGSLSVDYATLDGTAKSGSNYTATSGTLTWTDGDSSDQNVPITILYDGIQAPNLDFYLNLSNLNPAVTYYPNAITSSTITILDQEPGTFRMASSSYTVIEGQTATLTVERYSGSYGSVSVNVRTADGTAEFGVNYNTVNTNISFADGETSQTFNVVTINNNTDTSGSLFLYGYINSVAASDGTAFKGSPSSSIITILDFETGSISFSTSSAFIFENTASYYIGVERLIGGDEPNTASITFTGSNVALGSDYNVIYNSITQSSPFNIIWADQDKTTKYITASITDDYDVEPSGTVTFTIASSSISSIGPSSSFVLTIYDYENTGSVRFVTSSYSVSVPNSIVVQVERYGGADAPVSAVVDISSSSTAVMNVDYTDVFPYTLNWANQESGSKDIPITTLSNWNGGTRNLNLYFSSLTYLASGSIMSASVAITNTTYAQSTPPNPNVSPDFTINTFTNMSSQYTRRVEAVPLRFGIKGPASIRGNTYKITQGE